MKSQPDITIVGAGLLGLASAWALHNKGYQVQVLEAESGPGLGTSYANAGMLTPSMADPWNEPGIWRKLLAWLGQEDAPMLLRPAALPHYLGWGLRFLRYSAPAAHQRAMQANFALAHASVQQFQQWRDTFAFDYDLRRQGTLQVFRDEQSLGVALQRSRHLQTRGLQVELLRGDDLLEREPALTDSANLWAGGIHYPDDETGDAHKFCSALAQWLQQQGVEFVYDCPVQALLVRQGRVRALRCADGERPVERVVLAAAGHSARLAGGAGQPLSLRPVKGYSLTVPVAETDLLPQRSLIDHHLHAAATPFAKRLRLAGTAELAGWDDRLRPERIDALWTMLASLLPRLHASLDRAQAQPWAGFRPMSADGVPFIGASTVQGLYLNTGHGHLGWTQSLGSGRLLADLISGDTPLLDAAPYRPARA